MTTRERPAGDFDYEQLGAGYRAVRRPDPRIAAHVHAALGTSRTVLNVGAGAGSYEPADRYVLAVEPSAAMRAQRPAGAVPALDATAEHLPFDDDSFDAAMAMVTVHQWSRRRPGTARAAPGQPRAGRRADVRRPRAPGVLARRLPSGGDRRRAGAVPHARPGDGRPGRRAAPRSASTRSPCRGTASTASVRPTTDARRPTCVRRSEPRRPGVALADPETVRRGLDRLADDLASGAWDRAHGHLRTQAERAGALRLVTATA